MNRNAWVRQVHRWLAMTFVVTVVVTVAGLALGGPQWLSYVSLPPLVLLLASGLYLLARALRECGVRMARVRRMHRWSAAVLAVLVLASLVALVPEEPTVWVFYLPLIPLVVQLVTGLIMLVRRYSRRGADEVTTLPAGS